MTQQPHAVSEVALGKDVLIVVACHSIYLGGIHDGSDESEWLIEPFQRGETPTFIEHARRGVEELANSQGRGVLAFSGGATKKLKTGGAVQRTEAEGYMDIARGHGFWGFDAHYEESGAHLRDHMFQDDYATDSYQNVLLSLIQYPIWQRQTVVHNEETESIKPLRMLDLVLPEKLIIISHEFKRARFVDLHLPAIRSIWPLGQHSFDQMNIEFIGINPPFDEQKIREIEEGDRRRGYGVWKEDLYGVSKLLSDKRRERGWEANVFMEYLGNWFERDALPMLSDLVQGKKQIGELRPGADQIPEYVD